VPLSPEDVQALVAAFDGGDWDEMTVTIDGTRLALSRTGRPPTHADAAAGGGGGGQGAAPVADTAPGGASPAPAALDAAAPAPVAAASASPGDVPDGRRVTAPSVGLFWRSPKPGAPPFVDVGDEVGPDDTVCIVEVMKLMNHVRAGVAGTVRAVHPENGQMVEHGDPLFTIGP
jgi:acetyl-CoA carboxylase biotin carboxyl carrier protein